MTNILYLRLACAFFLMLAFKKQINDNVKLNDKRCY